MDGNSGTESDLRTLTMKQMASILRCFDMTEEQIDALKRWDRVHVIRDLSTKAAASIGDDSEQQQVATLQRWDRIHSIRNLAAKAAADGIRGDSERFSPGRKIKLTDQECIRVIWKRHTANMGDGAAAQGGTETDQVAPGKLVAQKKNDAGEDESSSESSSESSDDDSFVAKLTQDMIGQPKTNQLLVAAQATAEGTEGGGDAGQLFNFESMETLSDWEIVDDGSTAIASRDNVESAAVLEAFGVSMEIQEQKNGQGEQPPHDCQDGSTTSSYLLVRQVDELNLDQKSSASESVALGLASSSFTIATTSTYSSSDSSTSNSNSTTGGNSEGDAVSSNSSLVSEFDILTISGQTIKRCLKCTYHNTTDATMCFMCGLALVANPNILLDEEIAMQVQEDEQKRKRISEEDFIDGFSDLTCSYGIPFPRGGKRACFRWVGRKENPTLMEFVETHYTVTCNGDVTFECKCRHPGNCSTLLRDPGIDALIVELVNGHHSQREFDSAPPPALLQQADGDSD